MTASTATQPPDKLPPADGLDIDDWMVLAQHYQGELLKSEAAAIALRAERDAALARAEKAEAERDALTEKLKRASCVWCGAETTKSEIAEHIYECIKSPMGELARKWDAEKDTLRAELAQERARIEVWRDANSELKKLVDTYREHYNTTLDELTAARARLAELQAVCEAARQYVNATRIISKLEDLHECDEADWQQANNHYTAAYSELCITVDALAALASGAAVEGETK